MARVCSASSRLPRNGAVKDLQELSFGWAFLLRIGKNVLQGRDYVRRRWDSGSVRILHMAERSVGGLTEVAIAQQLSQ